MAEQIRGGAALLLWPPKKEEKLWFAPNRPIHPLALRVLYSYPGSQVMTASRSFRNLRQAATLI
jgi:hypothetical protein